MKTSTGTLTRLCLRLRTEDIEWINKLCAATDQEFNHIVREMVSTVVRQMRAKERREIDKIETPKVASETVREILELN